MSDISDSAANVNTIDENWRTKYGFMCGQCKKTFASRLTYLSHLSDKHPNQDIRYTCSLCLQDIPNYTKFRNHCYRHFISGRFKCEICSKTFSQQYELKHHIKGFHGNSFLCVKCKKSFYTWPGLKIHTQQCHSSINNNFDCDECGKTLHTQNGFAKHKAMHKLNRHFLCDLCGIRFNEKTNLIIHMRCHYDYKKYTCEICQLSFSSLSKLTEHSTTIHSDSRQYRCRICDKSYKTKRYMQYHFLQHNATKTFMCNVCDKGFLSASKLKNHQNIHFEEKPYKCEYCSMGFTNFANRLKHTRKIHKIDHKTKNPIYPENVSVKSETLIYDSGGDTKLNQNQNLTNTVTEPQKTVLQRNVGNRADFTGGTVPLFNTHDESTNVEIESDQLRSVDNIAIAPAYIYIDNISNSQRNITQGECIAISNLQNITKNDEITIMNDVNNIFSPNCLINQNDGLDNVPQDIHFIKNPSITIRMAETLREQELELTEDYIREQMKGCVSHKFPEVPDFNMCSTPTVYDTYSPNVDDIFDDLTVDPETKIEYKPITPTKIHLQKTKKHSPLCDDYEKNNSDTDIYPNISHDHEMWSDNVASHLHTESTSYSSTSFIYSNVDDNENATSDAQCNAWNIQHDSFYVAEQSKCNYDLNDLINDLPAHDLLTR